MSQIFQINKQVSSACLLVVAYYVQLCVARADFAHKSAASSEYHKLALNGSHSPSSQSGRAQHQVPHYDIIGWPDGTGGSNVDMERQLIKLLTSSKTNSSVSSSRAPGETDFHRHLHALKKVVQARKQGGKHGKNETTSGRRLQSSASSLEDDISTINVLIGMLMLANRRLIEQRDKQQLTTTIRPHHFQPLQSTHHQHHSRRPPSSPKIELESASQVSKVTAPTDAGSLGVRRKQATARHQGTTTSGRKNGTKALARKKMASGGSGSSRQSDLNLVRPGYMEAASTSHKALELDRRASGLQQQQQQAPHPFHDHQPLVARDLLQVERPTELAPENMFVSRPHPLYSSMSPHQQRQDPFAPQHHHYGHHLSGDSIELPGGTSTAAPGGHNGSPMTPMVPPYNSWSLLHPHQHPQHPHHLTTLMPARIPPPPTHQPPTPAATPSSAMFGGGGNELQQQEPPSSPLERMLAVAKSQQAAALEYERRRLEHELEIRRRQEATRAQHEQQHHRRQQQQQQQQQHQARLGATRRPPQQQQQQSNGSPEEPAGVNQLEEPPTTGKEDNQQQQQGDEGETGGGETGDNSGNQEGAREAQRQAEDDPDMRQLQGFTSDDFTDLFPPGILSEAEIKEMRRDQEEQRERQAQEEREKEAQEEQAQEEQPAAERGGEDESQQQQPPQQPQQTLDPAPASSNSSLASQQQQQQQQQQVTDAELSGGSSLAAAAANSSRALAKSAMEQQKATRFLPGGLMELGGQEPAARPNKTRRSQGAQTATETSQAAAFDDSISLEDYLAVSAGASEDAAAATGAQQADEAAAAVEPMEALAASQSLSGRHRRRR